MRANIGAMPDSYAAAIRSSVTTISKRAISPQFVRGILVPVDAALVWAIIASLEICPRTNACHCGAVGTITSTSVEQTPSTAAMQTLWKYGRNLPNRISPRDERRIGGDKVGLEVFVQVVVAGVGVLRADLPSMPRMARFILQSRDVVLFDSWP